MSIYTTKSLRIKKSIKGIFNLTGRCLRSLLRTPRYLMQRTALKAKRSLIEKALTESELKYRRLVENSSDMIYTINLRGNFIYVNPVAEHLLGWPRAEIVGKNYLSIVRSDFHEEIAAFYKKQYDEYIPNTYFEYPIVIRDGSVKWVGQNVQLLLSNGERSGFQAVVRDITARRRAEKALRDSETKYKLLAEKMTDIVWIMDLNLRTVYVSPSVEAVLGFTPEERIAQEVQEQLTPVSLSLAIDMITRELALEQEGQADPARKIINELEYYHKDGSTRWIENIISGIRDNQGVLTGLHGVSRDITRRKKAEDALKESEALFKNYLENAPDGVYLSDLKGNFLYGNRKSEEIIGYKREDLIGKNFLELNLLSGDSLNKAAYLIQASMEGKATGPDEIELIDKGGRHLPVEINTSLVQHNDQKIVVGFVRDISDRKRVEEALRRSEANYKQLFDNAPTGIYQLDYRTGKLSKANDVVCEYLGCSQEEINSFSPLDMLSPESKKIFLERIVKINSGEKVSENPEFEIIDRKGRRRWLQLNSKTFSDSAGLIIGADVVAHDITDRKFAEEELRESETKLQAIFDTVGTGIFIVDADTQTIIEANQTAIEMTGLQKERIIGQMCHSLVGPAETGKCPVKDLGQRVDNSERKLLCAGGDSKDILKTVYPIILKGRECYLESFIDISDRRKAEDALKESEKKYRELVDFLPISLFEMDKEGTIISGNQALVDTFGYKAEDFVVGVNAFNMFIPDDVKRMKVNIEMVLKGEKVSGYEYMGIRKDGSIFPLIAFSSPIIRAGKAMGLRGAIIDITELKQAEESLKKSNLSLANAQRIAHIGNWELDIAGKSIYCSDEVYRILGQSPLPNDKTYKTFLESFHHEDMKMIKQTFDKAIDKGIKSEIEHRIVRGDGSVREVRQRIESTYNDSGNAISIIGIIQDVTDQHQAERELQNARELLLQSEKLAAIGRLSAGVAHEILNPVNIISLGLQILQTIEDLPSEVLEEVDTCKKQISRIVTITDNLKQLSRTSKKKITSAGINNVIADILNLYAVQLKIEEIEIEVDYGADLPEIYIDKEKIDQVIMNLISNATAAMKGKTKKILHIKTEMETFIRGHQHQKIIIADTGTGIKNENMSKIFDPFFTTKEPGKGTGLGLSISYGIIHEHGGQIWAENNERGGASFYIRLPVKMDTEKEALIN